MPIENLAAVYNGLSLRIESQEGKRAAPLLSQLRSREIGKLRDISLPQRKIIITINSDFIQELESKQQEIAEYIHQLGIFQGSEIEFFRRRNWASSWFSITKLKVRRQCLNFKR